MGWLLFASGSVHDSHTNRRTALSFVPFILTLTSKLAYSLLLCMKRRSYSGSTSLGLGQQVQHVGSKLSLSSVINCIVPYAS